MNKDDIKGVISKLVPDEEMEQRILENLSQKHHSKLPLKYIASIAAALVIVVSLGLLGNNLLEKKSNTSPNTISSSDGVFIPKIELSKEPNVKADMIGLIVYQGKVYSQTNTNIDSRSAEKLLGEKLGTTKGNIDEWSEQKDYAVEFASTVGVQDVYTVKGYDKSFRIMTYIIIDGTAYAQFFEHLNGITVKNGNDLFGKLKIENNINSAKYEKFDSWNNSKQQYNELNSLEALNSFTKELKDTIPYNQESLSHLFDDNNGDSNQKFVYLSLKDGSEIQLRLFKDGYIFYGHIFFKMEKETFNRLWNELK